MLIPPDSYRDEIFALLLIGRRVAFVSVAIVYARVIFELSSIVFPDQFDLHPHLGNHESFVIQFFAQLSCVVKDGITPVLCSST